MTTAHWLPGPEASTRADISFVLQIDDVERECRLQWLPRIGEWALYVRAPDGQRVIDGLRVAGDTSLLGAFSDLRLPQGGHLVAVDSTGANQDPGRDDFRQRHLMMWISPEESVEKFVIKVDELIVPVPPS